MSGEKIVILSETTRMGVETGAGIMRNRCAFTSRDMAADWPEAFTYAIVSGWSTYPENDAMPELAAKYEWDDEMVAFLVDAHERFAQLADKHERQS
jgi:hypothetical protein